MTAPSATAEDERRIFVKVCGVTTEADALLAVAMGADAVGFIFAPSPRQMAPRSVAEIVRRLPHETVAVGVFRDEAPGRVVAIANHIGLHAVQLHGMESAEDTRWVAERVPWTIKAFPAGHPSVARFRAYGARTLLLDGAEPGSGALFDWRLAEGAVAHAQLMVSGGLRPDNVGQAVARLRPWGVDVASGVESSPGVKDPSLVRAFVAEARRAAAALPVDPEPDEDPGAEHVFDWQEE